MASSAPGTAVQAAHAARVGRIAMLVAAIAWSTAGIAQRGLEATAATQIFGRALFAFAALLIVVVLTERASTLRSLASLGRDGMVLAILLAVSSGTFMLALNYATVANVIFLQAASPIVAALLGWLWLHERIAPRTWLATAMAAFGVAMMMAGTFHAGAAAVLLPVAMTLSFAIIIVIARARREVSMLPATCASQALVVIVVAPFAAFGSATSSDWRTFAALGIFQMALGLALLTVGARLLPPAEVALLSLLEVVLAPLWVWLAYGERPGTTTLVGGAVVTAAIVVQATGRDGPTAVAEGIPLPGTAASGRGLSRRRA